MDPPGRKKSKRGAFRNLVSGRSMSSRNRNENNRFPVTFDQSNNNNNNSNNNNNNDGTSFPSDRSITNSVIRRQERAFHQAQQRAFMDQSLAALSPPSQLRQRKSLHKKAPSLAQYQITPITKHYEISKQILAAFDSHWSNHLWVTAYAVGLQFVETALLEIPKHGYFYSARHERERMESSIEAARVTRQLQDLLLLDEQQEGEAVRVDDKGLAERSAGLVPNGDLQRVKKLLALALEQVEQASTDQDRRTQAAAYESARAETEEELRYSVDDEANNTQTTAADWIVCEPLLACSESFCSSSQQQLQQQPSPSPSLSVSAAGSFATERYSIMSMNTGNSRSTEPSNASTVASSRIDSSTAMASSSRRHQQSFREAFDEKVVFEEEQDGGSSRSGSLDPVTGYSRSSHSMLPRPAGGSLSMEPTSLLHGRSNASESSAYTADSLLLEKALFLSGLEVSVASDYAGYDELSGEERAAAPPGEVKRRSQSSAMLQLETLAHLYHEDFDSLQQCGRVYISFANTYQGRLPGSTNGCTVIAPLLCIRHLLSDPLDQDPGLPDSEIEHCIDAETPAVLSQLRGQLGLSEHAFLIPSDAHDYLIDNGQLSQEQFQSVVGGNILDGEHVTAFVDGLEKTSDRKIAATLFFHEHVVAIVKLKRSGFGGKTRCWYDFIDSLPLKETLRRTNETATDLCRRLGMLTDLAPQEVASEDEMVALPRVARIRCLDAEALTAVIRWYACSKFNGENISFIDQYPWDDSNCDFDPRVFQAFVWGGIELDGRRGDCTVAIF